MTTGPWSRRVINSLVAIVLSVAIVLQGGVESIKPSDQPTLLELKNFYSVAGVRVHVGEHIGVHYEDFGYCLLNDDNGIIVTNIQQTHHYRINGIVNEILQRWISGSGKRPETWAVFVECLRVVSMHALADTIEAKYDCSDEAESDTAQDKVTVLTSPPSVVDSSTKTVEQRDANLQGSSTESKATPTTPTPTNVPVKSDPPTPTDSTVPVTRTAPQLKEKHPIKKFLDFKYAFLPVPCEEWEELCQALDVDDATLNDLRRKRFDCDKKDFCINDFFETGKATWERTMIALAREPLYRIVAAKSIGIQRNIDYYEVMGLERPSHPPQPNHHNIKKFDELKYAVLSVAYDDWEYLCQLLGVDEATMTDVKRHKGSIERWEFCLRDYFQYGPATWENVMQVVASSPLKQIVTAKVIGRKHGIDYYAAVNQKKPAVSVPPNHHKIKKFDDLKYAVLSVPYDDWEVFCKLLNVDETTLLDLNRWRESTKKWEFCLEEFYRYGESTWEAVMKAVASSPIDLIVTAKTIARKYGINFYTGMGLDPPTHSLQPNEHKIKKFDQLKYALLNLPYEDWEALCQQLGVDEATVTNLKQWRYDIEKWTFCLQDYIDLGRGTWEHVISIVASEPFNEIVRAKMIARQYAINYESVMDMKRKDEL